MLKDISANEGLELILENTQQLGTEKVFINEALNRVIAQDIISSINIPPFDNSAMDGYAIKSIDTEDASLKNPVKLKLIEEIPAGKVFEGKIKSGEAIKIMTGGRIPEGADAVVRKEDVKEEKGYIFIFNKVSPFKDIRKKGEDIKKGETAIFKGDILSPSKIGILASLGVPYVEIYKKPSVVIISTGNEIIDIEESLNIAKIRNSNAFTLEALLKEWNINPQKTPIIKDDLNALKNVIQQNINSNIILSTGGVSVGDYDFIKKVIENLGFKIIFWRLRVKPGKPLLFAIKDNTLYFGIPGNPVSTMTTFYNFILPCLMKMMGFNFFNLPEIEAILLEDLKRKDSRKEFIRGIVKKKENFFYVSSTGPQGSGILKSMAKGNCFIVIEEGQKSAKKGDKVKVKIFDKYFLWK